MFTILSVFNARAHAVEQTVLVDELVFDHGRQVQPDQADQRESGNGVDFLIVSASSLLGATRSGRAARQTTPPGSPWPSCRPSPPGAPRKQQVHQVVGAMVGTRHPA